VWLDRTNLHHAPRSERCQLEPPGRRRHRGSCKRARHGWLSRTPKARPREVRHEHIVQIHTCRECCSRPPRRAAASTCLPNGGAGSGPLCSTRTGLSCTTCAAPARNGEKSTGAVLGSRANWKRSWNPSTGARPMTTTEHAANTARAFLSAEIVMASVNCGAANVTRAQAEKLLDDYFARVEQAIPWTEINPLDRRS